MRATPNLKSKMEDIRLLRKSISGDKRKDLSCYISTIYLLVFESNMRITNASSFDLRFRNQYYVFSEVRIAGINLTKGRKLLWATA